MRVLHLCSYYIGQRLYQLLFAALDTLGVSQDVFVPAEYGKKPAFEVPEGTRVIPCYSKTDRLFFYHKENKMMSALMERYDIHGYDMTHAHSLFANGYLAFLLRKKYGTRYIVAVRNTDMNVFFKYFVHLRGLGNEILKEASRVVFLSQSYKDALLSKYVRKDYLRDIEAKSVVIPNGINRFWLENRPAGEKLAAPGRIRIVFVAQKIDKNKNVQKTVQACKILMSAGNAIEFNVIGKIVSKAVDRKLVKNSFVRVVPCCPKEDLIKYYRDADIFVMPSFTETFGLVYAEALSQGLPVIYTAGQGFDRQFPEGYIGYSVNPRDAKDIAEKILKARQNYTEIQSRTVQAARKFDWASIAEEYRRLYHGAALEKQ